MPIRLWQDYNVVSILLNTLNRAVNKFNIIDAYRDIAIYIYVIFFTIQRKMGCYHNYFYMFIILISSCNGSGGLYFWIKVILALVFVVDITYINLSPLIVERRSLLKNANYPGQPASNHC